MKKVTSDLIYILHKKKPQISGLMYSESTTAVLHQIIIFINRDVILDLIEKQSYLVKLCTSEAETG